MRNLVFQGVEFRSTSIAPSGAYDVLKALKNHENAVRFDETRNVFPMIGGAFVVAYESSEARDLDAAQFSSIGHLDGRDPDSQIPEICGTFEYEGRACLILQSKKSRSSITNSYAYEGVVINPKRFSELVDSGMFAIISGTKDKTHTLTEPAA